MDTPVGFRNDLRISTRPVIWGLLITSLGIFIAANFPATIGEKFSVVGFSFFVLALTGQLWYVAQRRPDWARWLAVLSVALTCHLAGYWLGWAESLQFAVIPVVLAAALIDQRAAVFWMISECLIVILVTVLTTDISTSFFFGSLFTLAVIFITILAMYQPLTRTARWVWQNYTTAQELIHDSRQRTMELEQALQGLSDANMQLARLNQLAQGFRNMAEDARTAKEHFVANVSHELRTPLNMIIGFVEMILQAPEMYGKKIPPTLLADLTVIHRNAEHLSNLIDDVLDLSQIENEQMALSKEKTDIREIIEFACSAVTPLYRTKGLYLKTEIPQEPCELLCDPTRIREVLLNLLGNAGRFTEKGGVMVRVSEQETNLLVSVEDTGPGIAPEDLGRIFQPFEQLDPSIRRRHGGTGLGLAISKRFVELHQGRIWVESEVGVGTKFRFTLPLRDGSRSPRQSPARWLSAHLPVEERAHLPRIPMERVIPQLIVLETNGTLKKLLSRYLNEIQVIGVSSLASALDAAQNLTVNAILVNSSSLQAGADPGNLLAVTAGFPPEIPILTVNLPNLSEETAMEMGVEDILVKPIQRQRLLECLERLCPDRGVILIVDDEPDILQLYGRMLASSGRGYKVLLASDGLQALKILEQYQPNVILLDLIMPNQNGFEFLEVRQGRSELRSIPVVVISARDPGGSPIVARGIQVSQNGGFSIQEMLAHIQYFSRLSPSNVSSGDPVRKVNRSD